ncbi:MAG: hypothetical protein A2W90_11995 [Bacteroidetes bacterium GWF2_42_66]|nr:MAG: hypothetical protein A2W92_23430 [Bacteroidetes bacterium GWA2_42_15]OFX99914.1 MAG: hypothetical protein A2W89_16980 [Bacteroidetes bacterium GWE2_42_39]OFY40099.1 MAG: hypothetical protein A2W90_11995 [Bacteroidetes bacterium GWF2_42_66]HBL73921.1 hypothetical protein [Prolixibacteraceae bacterium]HCR89269.1 hypothetical protein [Prolixibacteraceae bacterium]
MSEGQRGVTVSAELYAGQLQTDLQEVNMLKNSINNGRIAFDFIFLSGFLGKITEKKQKNCRIGSDINKNCIFM